MIQILRRSIRLRNLIVVMGNTYLVMTPGQHDIVETTVWLVDTILGRVDRIPAVRVGSESLWVDDLVRVLAADYECILNSGKAVRSLARS